MIYWAWNNTLSVTQQWFIMKRHGAEVNLFGNILDTFKRKPKPAEPTEGLSFKDAEAPFLMAEAMLPAELAVAEIAPSSHETATQTGTQVHAA